MTYFQIDGTFRVNKPPVLLGYTSDAANNKVESGGATYDMGIGDRESTYLSTFITIEPQLTPAEPMKEKVSQGSSSLEYQSKD